MKRAKISSFRIFTKDRKFYFSKIKSGTVATKVASYDDKEGLLRRNHS